MSQKNDDSQRTDSSQEKKRGKSDSAPRPNLNQQDAWGLVARILQWIVVIIESDSMRTLEGRISLLVCGGWLPGLGDVRTVAALTGKAERTIEDAVTNSPRTKHYIGRQVFYRLSDFPMANAEVKATTEKPEKDSAE